MNLNETDPAKRRIPLTIQLADGSGLATSVDASSPTVLVARNSSTLIAAGGALAHVSNESRLHYYEASAAEATTPGFLLVVVIHASIQTAIAWESIGPIFSTGETDPLKLRLPLTIYDTASPPALATGATVTTGADLQSSISGAAFGVDPGLLVEIGHGAYYWQAAASAAVVPGRAFVKYESTGFGAAITSVDVAAASAITVVVAPALAVPIKADPTLAPGIPTIDLIALALSRLPHQYRSASG